MQTPQATFLTDYQPPNFQINSVYLTLELTPEVTQVKNVMQITRLNADTKLVLDGEHLVLDSVYKDGKRLTSGDYQLDDRQLILNCLDKKFELEINTKINPQQNTRLEGLYRSSGNYCTQCEAEGFRTISYFLDRPDVLTFFTTKIIADKTENTVLLSNGNLIEEGDLPGNKHFAVWEDPYKKPCYLFALVAGNLEVLEDTYQTLDGREVALKIFVQAKNIDKCDHAMVSLKKSMKWDEDRFGLIYDLDSFMIVAVDDFNMGAMENKGLNIFNSKFVLAKPDTATDIDFEGIEAVIAHEYFHNWTGNRVTCKNWFQLTLKEGLTVFRDQEFTADMLSANVKRIQDVKALRNNQFPEDAGPMSHPIQPQSYIEMNNFYTMTVYEKGAEVVRLYHTLLGEEGFRKGMDLYFKRFDGQAVAVEDFRNAMADANSKDLSQLHNWYIQSGTPTVKVRCDYRPEKQQLFISFTQFLKNKVDHKPLLIPVVFEVLSSSGQVLKGIESKDCRKTDRGWLFEFCKISETITFNHVKEESVLSLFRGFSAPVIIDYELSHASLEMLAVKDKDSFVRWESGQEVILNAMVESYYAMQKGAELSLNPSIREVISGIMSDESFEESLKALALEIPSKQYFIEFLVEKGESVELDFVLMIHQFVEEQIAQIFKDEFLNIYHKLNLSESYSYNKQSIGNRNLKNRSLFYLGLLSEHQNTVVDQFNQHSHMTDVSAALTALKPFDSQASKQCLADFYEKWQDDLLVMDKWFAAQASCGTIDTLKELIAHQDFSYTNPNRLRSVLGIFGRINLKAFHRKDGSGYAFLASEVLKVDKINPQVAARLVAVFSQWHKYDETRQALMKNELVKMYEQKGLSKDVYEIVSKSIESEEK